jgi:4-hydroxy-tetrahydrodipicolinate synthase
LNRRGLFFLRKGIFGIANQVSPLSGVWLPLVTPFLNGQLDLGSYERLLHHYLDDKGISGFVPLGTTGERPTLDPEEFEAIVETTTRVVAGRLPIYVGVGGNCTATVVRDSGA